MLEYEERLAFPRVHQSPRDEVHLVFFPDPDELLLFGGAEIDSEITPLNDSWLWEGSEWKQVNAEGPPARVHPARYGFVRLAVNKLQGHLTYNEIGRWMAGQYFI